MSEVGRKVVVAGVEPGLGVLGRTHYFRLVITEQLLGGGTTEDVRTVVRDTSVSRHHAWQGQLRAQHYYIEGFKGGP